MIRSNVQLNLAPENHRSEISMADNRARHISHMRTRRCNPIERNIKCPLMKLLDVKRLTKRLTERKAGDLFSFSHNFVLRVDFLSFSFRFARKTNQILLVC